MAAWTTSEALNAHLRSLGRPVRSVAILPPFGLEVLAVRTGGSKGPPILITAGSHADEAAGVLAAVEYAESLQTEHETWVVPLRDPLGWNGFAWTYRQATGRPAGWDSYQALREELHRGTTIVHEDDQITLGQVDCLAFAAVELGPWCSTEVARHFLGRVVREHPAVAERLRGCRVVIPGNVAYREDRGPFDWGGHTAYVSANGFASNLNRFFDRDDAPAEVSGVRALADELRPGLTLDLHEGFSSDFYLFVGPDSPAETRELARAMVSGAQVAGFRTASWDDLAPTWGPDVSRRIQQLEDGIYGLGATDGGPRATFSAYCEAYGPALVTESGMAGPLARRVAMIRAGATAAIRAWESNRTHH